MSEDDLRLTDILTTALAVANYLAAPTVTAAHALDAVALLRDEQTMDDLGRPLSPLVRRGQAAVDEELQRLAQRWFEQLGSSVTATLDDAQLEALLAELRALATRGSP